MKLDFERFLNENGIKVGDNVKLKIGVCTIYRRENDAIMLLSERGSIYNIGNLQYDFELIKSKKTVGDLICKSIFCGKCPLNSLVCAGGKGSTLRERFKLTLEKYPELEPMRTYLENELNKDVEE